MHFSNRLRAGWLFAPNKDGGAAVETPPEETPAETPPEETPPANEETPPEETPPETPPAETPPDPLAELKETIARQQAELEELKGKIPAPTPGEKTPAAIPDFRTKAFEEAEQYAQFVDEAGNLTAEGIAWAENKALADATEWKLEQRDAEQAKHQLEAQRPALESGFAKELETLGLGEESAQIARDYTNGLIAYGPAAFKTDEKVYGKEAATQAQHLNRISMLMALGLQKEREIAAKKEGGDATPAHKENPNPGGGSEGGIYAGLPESDVKWLKEVWAKERNGGKVPTKADIDKLKEKGVI